MRLAKRKDDPLSLEGRWVVETLAVGGELVPVLEGSTLTFEVSGSQAVGSAGVNRFMGQLDGPSLSGPLATTMMEGPPELMAQERLYLGHLDSVDSYEIEGGEMRLIAGALVVVTLQDAGTDDESETS